MNGEGSARPKVTRFYRSIDFAKEVLRDRKIAFVRVSELNDPFDPYAFFETDFGDSYPGLLTYVKENHPGDLGWFRAQVPAANWVTVVREVKDLMNKLREHTFIFSTSSAFEGLEPKHNLYMWGHYANGHRGVAIEFDVTRLGASVLAHHKEVTGTALDDTPIWVPIEYVASHRALSASDFFEFFMQEKQLERGLIKERGQTSLDEYYRRVTTLKSEVWQRENELRLMWRDDKADARIHHCAISADSIKSIYIGLSFAGDVDEVVALAKGSFPGASVFRAVKRHGNFAIDFQPL